jgi:hypothetical protein
MHPPPSVEKLSGQRLTKRPSSRPSPRRRGRGQEGRGEERGEIVQPGGRSGRQPPHAGDMPCGGGPHRSCSGHVPPLSDGTMRGEGCGPGRRSLPYIYLFRLAWCIVIMTATNPSGPDDRCGSPWITRDGRRRWDTPRPHELRAVGQVRWASVPLIDPSSEKGPPDGPHKRVCARPASPTFGCTVWCLRALLP